MNEVVIKPSLREQFLQGWAQCRVIFFSAPCGFGKSTAATALLSNHKTCVFSAEDPEFLREPVPKNVDAIVIDSLPALKDPEDQQTLCAWIRENPELHFVILSRGVLPGWLMPFRFTGLLQLIEARDLLFDRDTVRVFLETVSPIRRRSSALCSRKSITILRITSSTAFQCRCAVCCLTSPRSIHSTPSLPR